MWRNATLASNSWCTTPLWTPYLQRVKKFYYHSFSFIHLLTQRVAGVTWCMPAHSGISVFCRVMLQFTPWCSPSRSLFSCAGRNREMWPYHVRLLYGKLLRAVVLAAWWSSALTFSQWGHRIPSRPAAALGGVCMFSRACGGYPWYSNFRQNHACNVNQ